MKNMKKGIFGNKQFIPIAVASLIVVAAIIAGVLYSSKDSKNEISSQEASAKTETFINDNLMPEGSKAKIIETSEEYDLYKMKIDIGSEAPVESYVTKDGRLFFPQALEMTDTKTPSDNNQASGNPTPVNVPKSDKPEIELFVMSYCPFGTQMEKGMLSVLETLGNKVDFKLKFNDYAMHDKIELDENLVQYCIQKEQPEKLTAYLACFLDAGDRSKCVAANTDQNKINACVASTDKEFKVTENFNNKVDWRGNFPGFNVNKGDNEKYNVGGSPTLVINGATVSSARDSASLLRTICAAFNNAPEECSAQLNTQSPTSGFGFDYSAASSAQASCN